MKIENAKIVSISNIGMEKKPLCPLLQRRDHHVSISNIGMERIAKLKNHNCPKADQYQSLI